MNPAIIVFPAGVIAAASIFHGVDTNRSHALTHTTVAHIIPNTRGHVTTMARISQRAGTITMMLRNGNTLRSLRVTAAALRAADGRVLSASSVRNGDTVAVTGATVRDLSQRWTTLGGIVSSVGSSTSDSLILQVRSNYAVVADVSSNTRYSDPSGQTTVANEIEDADIMHLSGTYDARLGEMTDVSTMTRLGPYRHSGKR